jgi:hypothetical protein
MNKRILFTAIATLSLAQLSDGHEFSGPQGSVIVDWSAENVSRVLSSGYGDSFGMEAAVKLGFPEPELVGDKQCVSGSYFLFDVDDAFAFDIDEPVELEVLIDRRESTGLLVSYDRNARSEPMFEVKFDEGAEGLITQRIQLDRARFANRGEAHSDIMLGGLSAYYPGIPDGNHRIVICDLQIHRSNETPALGETAELRLAVIDETGTSTPVRVGLYAANGRLPLPSDDALPIRNYDDTNRQLFLRATHPKVTLWPHDNRHVFYIDGNYRAELPVGDYTLILSKGPEYRVHQQTVSISSGGTDVEVSMQRFGQMNRLGWFSGDGHVHMTRNEVDNESIQKIMQAEDIQVTNVLQMGNPAAPHFMQYAMGNEGRYFVDHHGLVPGVEDPRTALRGHTISLNIDEVIRNPDDYLLYDEVFARYRAQGGMSGYAHVAGDWFNVGRGLALDVPLGAVDFIEVLQDGELGTSYWYDFLNLGFNVVPTAGSDFPYLNQPGAERVYVEVGNKFSPDTWFENLKLGRSFVSNGPLLSFTANGQGIGSVIEAATGDKIRIVAGASLNPDYEVLDRVEIVIHGKVVASSDSIDDANSALLSHTIEVKRGVWIAVRAYGVEQSVAHSAPIFVVTDERGFRNDRKIPEIVPRMLSRLDEFQSLEVDVEIELEVWEVGEALEKMLPVQHAAILRATERARAVYQALLDDVQSRH